MITPTKDEIEACDELVKLSAGRTMEEVRRPFMSLGEALAHILHERGLKITSREATEEMKEKAQGTEDDWVFMHDAAPLVPKL